ncbi:Nucleolar and coiled-body phosphoprotein 1 [Acropora cervicornis]|uniref:Nucleolar and coiled-body phosphoprotein 1 n=1 Tax=Acropora cervicornis TaxID=6130 RepID=A0AAD9QRS8_ACRCE|nr:Nucleolar and coiled-body phosphoprotein 1 [Acropora cervicornis]
MSTTTFSYLPAASTPASNSKVNVKDGGSKTSFRRVKEEDIAVDPRLKDNSFEAKAGSRGDWGEKANKDLKFVKGGNTCTLEKLI